MRKISKQLSVVLVEDDLDDRQIFTEALDEIVESAKLSTFSDGQAFINHLRKVDIADDMPDVIFLDINMPVLDGHETLEIIRSEFKALNLRIAIYSTSSQEIDIERSLINGANIYLVKPSSFEKLKSAVYKVLISCVTRTREHDDDSFLLLV